MDDLKTLEELCDLKKRLGLPPKFEVVLEMLDEYTAPPKDGDYDRHTQEAMKAVYDIMLRSIKKYREVMNQYRDDLFWAAECLKDRKKRMNSTTTNSDVDYFIGRYGGR